MANKPIKSIKYPGLSDTYTFAQIDTTLSQSGHAADAKKTGDAITGLKADLNAVDPFENVAFSESNCQQGLYGASVGTYDSNHNNSICSKDYIPNKATKIYCTNAYKMRLQAWENNIYKGVWNGSGFVTQNPNYFQTIFDLFALSQSFPNYTYKFVLFASDGTSAVAPTDAVNVYAQYSKWTKQSVLNDGIDSVLDYTDKATWEVGSIYQDGGAYDGNTRAIRTPIANKIHCQAGIVVNTANAAIRTLFAFRYDEYGTYVGRIGEVDKKAIVIPTDGYYRFVLISYADITSSEIPIYSYGFTIMGKALSEIVANINQTYAHHTTGKKIDLSTQGFNVAQRFSLPSTSIHEGLIARQDFDVYNDVLFQLYSDNYVALVNNNTGDVITHYAINSGHGNACQFSDEFYDPNDTYPMLYCFAYSTNLVYVNRVTDSGATLVRTYKLDTAGYRFSGGLDIKNNQLVTIHYINNSSLDATNNGCKISVWDLSDTTTDANDGTLKPTLIKQTEVAFLPVIQGCTVFKDILYVCNGYENPNIPVKITGYNKNGDIVTEVADFPMAIVNSESESITFYRTDNKYKCYFATYKLYELTFE